MQNNQHFTSLDLQAQILEFQPAPESPPSSDIIAFCGRIDEREVLAARLAVDSKTYTDPALLMLAYHHWNTGMVKHLIGDFSFVIYDRTRNRLFGARDALGTHSLFYSLWGQSVFVSGSMTQLLDHPSVGRRLNHRKLAGSAVLLSDDSHQTFFEDVFSLPGGHAFSFDTHGFKIWQYWQPDAEKCLDIPDKDVPEALRALLFDAVSARLPQSTTPAALLSGGLDSSALVAISAAILKQQNRRLLAISAVLPERLRQNMVDERPFISAFTGNDVIEFLEVTDEHRGPFDQAEEKIRRQCAPFLTSRHYQYSAFSEAAQARGATSIIDGCFGELGPTHYGNGFYAELFRSGQWSLLTREIRARAKVYQIPVSQVAKSELLKYLAPEWLLRFAGRSRRFDLQQSTQNQPFQTRYLSQHLQNSLDKLLVKANHLVQDYRSPRAGHARNISMLQKRLTTDEYQNPTQLIYPFLDKRVVEFCLAAPTHLKVRNGYPRSLVRTALDGLLPPSIQWRTSKEPFAPDFHLRYNRQRPLVEQFLAGISPNDPVREVVDIARLQIMAKHDMQTNRCNTPADFIAMHMVPRGVYLIHFLRQFSEFSVP